MKYCLRNKHPSCQGNASILKFGNFEPICGVIGYRIQERASINNDSFRTFYGLVSKTGKGGYD